MVEGAAIELNDYFTLGMTLGVPALGCFLVYVGLAMKSKVGSKSKVGRRPTTVHGRKSGEDATGASVGSQVRGDGLLTTDHGPLTTDHWLRATCRAGAIVLLVGFWFDGGLFKLATATVFWILIELGREDFQPQMDQPAPEATARQAQMNTDEADKDT